MPPYCSPSLSHLSVLSHPCCKERGGCTPLTEASREGLPTNYDQQRAWLHGRDVHGTMCSREQTRSSVRNKSHGWRSGLPGFTNVPMLTARTGSGDKRGGPVWKTTCTRPIADHQARPHCLVVLLPPAVSRAHVCITRAAGQAYLPMHVVPVHGPRACVELVSHKWFDRQLSMPTMYVLSPGPCAMSCYERGETSCQIRVKTYLLSRGGMFVVHIHKHVGFSPLAFLCFQSFDYILRS